MRHGHVVRVVSCSAFFVAALAGTACGGSSTTAPATSVSIVGAWSLQTVNGSPLPFVMDQNGADKSEMTADVVTFLVSGQFTEVAQVRITSGGQVTTQSVPQAGTFAASKGAVALTFAGNGSQAQGSQSGSTLTLVLNGLAFFYRKQ